MATLACIYYGLQIPKNDMFNNFNNLVAYNIFTGINHHISQ